MDTTQTRYPKAESIARKMRLPLAVDPVARELYGVSDAVLDEGAARRQLRAAIDPDFGAPSVAEMDAALVILRERAAAAVQL